MADFRYKSLKSRKIDNIDELLRDKCLCLLIRPGYFAVQFADRTWRHLDLSDPQFSARREHLNKAPLKNGHRPTYSHGPVTPKFWAPLPYAIPFRL